MTEQVNIRYTHLDNGNWLIESATQAPLSVIRTAMQFVDDSGTTHTISEIVKPEGSPKAPYYYLLEATVND